MKSLPQELHCKNKINFKDINYDRILGMFRQQIYEHIINRKDENDYFALDVFETKFLKEYPNTIETMTKTIIKELELLEWKCKLSFGDTGLFIYSTEKPPRSCW